MLFDLKKSVTRTSLLDVLIQGAFLHWASPKKLKYGKPRLGESTLT